MIQIRRSHERGHANHGWLDSYHTFSFADYHDPAHTHFRQLRVINEDWVAPGSGFGTHPHRDMEIITYVLEGALEHKDSTGAHGVIRPGDVQRMSAGIGVRHSEYNASKEEKVHLLQMWIFPDTHGLTPEYEQKSFEPQQGWHLLVTSSKDANANGAMRIHQDAKLYRALMKDGDEMVLPLDASRYGYLQVTRGMVSLNDTELRAGDAAEISAEARSKLRANSEAEVLLFDLA